MGLDAFSIDSIKRESRGDLEEKRMKKKGKNLKMCWRRGMRFLCPRQARGGEREVPFNALVNRRRPTVAVAVEAALSSPALKGKGKGAWKAWRGRLGRAEASCGRLVLHYPSDLPAPYVIRFVGEVEPQSVAQLPRSHLPYHSLSLFSNAPH